MPCVALRACVTSFAILGLCSAAAAQATPPEPMPPASTVTPDPWPKTLAQGGSSRVGGWGGGGFRGGGGRR